MPASCTITIIIRLVTQGITTHMAAPVPEVRITAAGLTAGVVSVAADITKRFK